MQKATRKPDKKKMYMKNYKFKHKLRMQYYIFQRPTLTMTRDGSDGKLAQGK